MFRLFAANPYWVVSIFTKGMTLWDEFVLTVEFPTLKSFDGINVKKNTPIGIRSL